MVEQLDGPAFASPGARHARLDYVSQALADGDAVASVEAPQSPPAREREEQLETPVRKPLAHETLPPRKVAAVAGLADAALQSSITEEGSCGTCYALLLSLNVVTIVAILVHPKQSKLWRRQIVHPRIKYH